MKILSAEYVKSYAKIRDYDVPYLPTVAFIGRSNVGKSTLINNLVNRKKLVKTSSTPGKTQLLNYFLINNAFYLVDLPGYGFANVPVPVKERWMRMIEDFVLEAPNLYLMVQLVDIRHKPNQHDIDFQAFLQANDIPNMVIANKLDKIKRGQVQKSLKVIRETLDYDGKIHTHSSLTKVGKQEIWESLCDRIDYSIGE